MRQSSGIFKHAFFRSFKHNLEKIITPPVSATQQLSITGFLLMIGFRMSEIQVHELHDSKLPPLGFKITTVQK